MPHDLGRAYSTLLVVEEVILRLETHPDAVPADTEAAEVLREGVGTALSILRNLIFDRHA
jgi:hypothetical protein